MDPGARALHFQTVKRPRFQTWNVHCCFLSSTKNQISFAGTSSIASDVITPSTTIHIVPRALVTIGCWRIKPEPEMRWCCCWKCAFILVTLTMKASYPAHSVLSIRTEASSQLNRSVILFVILKAIVLRARLFGVHHHEHFSPVHCHILP